MSRDYGRPFGRAIELGQEVRLGFTTFWIITAIILYVAVGLLAGTLFSPSLRRQMELATTGADASEYARAAHRTTTTGLITMLPIAAILYLMVMKPTP
jgi:uncharacterized membrane protein